MDSGKNFISGGGVLGKVRQTWTLGRISFQGGVFWVRSDLDSGKNFISGGCSGTKSQNRGVLENLVKNFLKPS